MSEESARRKRILQEGVKGKRNALDEEGRICHDTSDVFGTILGINSIFFYLASTLVLTGTIFLITDLTSLDLSSSNLLILGFTLSTTLTFSLLDEFWESVGRIPLKATVLVILISTAATVWGGMMFKEQLGKDITGSSDEVLLTSSLMRH